MLAEEFGVTTETIRRDLSTLERQSVVTRVHGGAIPTERLGFEPGVSKRSGVMVAEKERIAKAALAEIPDDGAVLIDAGTTTAQLAQAIPTDRELTVVTNSAPIAVTLAAKPQIKVLLVGGRVRGRTLAAVGDWTTTALHRSTSTSRSSVPTGSRSSAASPHRIRRRRSPSARWSTPRAGRWSSPIT